MNLPDIASLPAKYNDMVIRERVLLLAVSLLIVFFIWYSIWGLSLENTLATESNKRENLIAASESIISQYGFSEDKESKDRSVTLIGNRMVSVKSKMQIIDDEIRQFNEKTIAIGEIVLLLKDLLSDNQGLSLESLQVYPAEVIKSKNSENKSFEDAFEKNVIALQLKGSYANVFDYLKKVEGLDWSVFWQDVKYSVSEYPSAIVDIQLYTLSIVGVDNNGV